MSAALNRVGMDLVVRTELRRWQKSEHRRFRRVALARPVPLVDGVRLAEIVTPGGTDRTFILDWCLPQEEGAQRPAEFDWDVEHVDGAVADVVLADPRPGHPGGLVPLFTCSCGDGDDGFTAVRFGGNATTVTWSAPVYVAAGTWDEEPAGGHGWVFDRTEYLTWARDYAAAAEAYQDARDAQADLGGIEWDGGAAWPDGRSGLDRAVARLRQVAAAGPRLSEERLESVLARHDPLCLRELGTIDSETYEGPALDLRRRPPGDTSAAGLRLWFQRYFAAVWERSVDEAALERAVDELLEHAA